MNSKFSNNVYYFVAVLFFLAAWKIAPGADGGHGTWYMLSGLIAFAAMAIAIEGVKAAAPEPSPLRGRVGRILWTVRPRLWLIAWGSIIWAAWAYGTPHIAWNYPPRLPPGQCEYLGLNGIRVAPSDGGGTLNGCRGIRFF